MSLPCRLRLRLSVALALASVAILIDEALKEGYVLDPADILGPGLTHEKAFIALLALALLLGLRTGCLRGGAW